MSRFDAETVTALVILVMVPDAITTAPVLQAVIFPSMDERLPFAVVWFAAVAAPLGRAVTTALTRTASFVSSIADSPLGVRRRLSSAIGAYPLVRPRILATSRRATAIWSLMV